MSSPQYLRLPAETRDRVAFTRPVIHPLVSIHPLISADPTSALRVSEALYHGILEGTQARYDSATRRYLSFCLLRGLTPWPTDAILIVAWLHRLICSVKVSSMRHYISAVRKHQINLGMVWTLSGDESIHSCLRYLSRHVPEATALVKVPISLALLRRILPMIDGWPHAADMSHDGRLYVSVSLHAVLCFLRGGEFLVYPSSERRVLLMSSIRAHEGSAQVPASVIISVPQPKTRPDLICVDVPCFDSPFHPLFQPYGRWMSYVGMSPVTITASTPAYH